MYCLFVLFVLDRIERLLVKCSNPLDNHVPACLEVTASSCLHLKYLPPHVHLSILYSHFEAQLNSHPITENLPKYFNEN